MANIEKIPEASKSERRQAQKKFGKELKVLDKEISKRRMSSDGFMVRASASGQKRQFKNQIKSLKKHPSDLLVEEEIRRGAKGPRE